MHLQCLPLTHVCAVVANTLAVVPGNRMTAAVHVYCWLLLALNMFGAVAAGGPIKHDQGG